MFSFIGLLMGNLSLEEYFKLVSEVKINLGYICITTSFLYYLPWKNVAVIYISEVFYLFTFLKSLKFSF